MVSWVFSWRSKLVFFNLFIRNSIYSRNPKQLALPQNCKSFICCGWEVWYPKEGEPVQPSNSYMFFFLLSNLLCIIKVVKNYFINFRLLASNLNGKYSYKYQA